MRRSGARAGGRSALAKAKRAKVQAATVRLPRTAGLGILVPGRLVLTAAHCIESYNSGGMTLGDSVEVIELPTRRRVRVRIFAVEPVADIAVLGPGDRQVLVDGMSEVMEAAGLGSELGFEEWCDVVDGVPLAASPRLGGRINVHILTHKGDWVTGTAMRSLIDSGRLTVHFDAAIGSGTSGGPVVNDEGQIVGVISFSNEPTKGSKGADGMIPLAACALPRWVWGRVTAEQRRGQRPNGPRRRD